LRAGAAVEYLGSTPLRFHDEGESGRLCGVASASLDACECTACIGLYASRRGPFGENVLLLTQSGAVLASGGTWDSLAPRMRARGEELGVHAARRAEGFRPLPSLGGIRVVQVACGGRLAGAISLGCGFSDDQHKERCTSYALFLSGGGAVLSACLGGASQAQLGRRARGRGPQLVECLERERVVEARTAPHRIHHSARSRASCCALR
jgi:hypothetical protein